MRRRARNLGGLLWSLLLLAQPASAWTVVDPGHGGFALVDESPVALELSDIAWVAEDRYYTVSDSKGWLVPLQLRIDAEGAAIVSARLGPTVELEGRGDVEGVAVRASTASVFVSTEQTPEIREHEPETGALLSTVALPAVFSRAHRNYGLESLSLSPVTGKLWTANEESLRGDFARAHFSGGAFVRLQRFDASFEPDGQWVYVTDPIPGDLASPGRDLEASGVVAVEALDDGRLLVLERALGGASGLRARLYLVDFDGATDVSAAGALSEAETFTLVAKSLLWETSGLANYEGLTMGPPLADGTRALVLVSDDGSGLPQRLLVLRLQSPGAARLSPPGSES